MNQKAVRGPCIGELDICRACSSSPHLVACPYHQHFDNELFSYALVGVPEEVGSAAFWVNETFAAAARCAGFDEGAALIEGIQEFSGALGRGEIVKVGR